MLIIAAGSAWVRSVGYFLLALPLLAAVFSPSRVFRFHGLAMHGMRDAMKRLVFATFLAAIVFILTAWLLDWP